MSKRKKGLEASFPGGDLADNITVTTTDPSRIAEIKKSISGGTVTHSGEIASLLPPDVMITEGYRACLMTMHQASRHPPSEWKDALVYGDRTDKQTLEHSRHMWILLKSAKIVAIPTALYLSLHHKWDRKMCDELGFIWRDPRLVKAGKLPSASQGERVATARHTCQRAGSVPFPEDLPFEVTYFAYGSDSGFGPELDHNQLVYRTNSECASRMRNVSVLGTMVSATGHCVDFLIGSDLRSSDPRVPTIFTSVQCTPDKEGWVGFNIHDAEGGRSEGDYKIDLSPLLLTDIVEHVNSFVELRIPGGYPKDSKTNWRRRRKHAGITKGEPPPQFYPYKLRSEVHAEPTDGAIGEPRVLTYRTDVRAHERLLIRRGELPMPVRRHGYYVKNGFSVYLKEDLPTELRRRISIKGHRPKMRHEWMAIKRVWVRHHMNSNDNTLPYRAKLTIA